MLQKTLELFSQQAQLSRALRAASELTNEQCQFPYPLDRRLRSSLQSPPPPTSHHGPFCITSHHIAPSRDSPARQRRFHRSATAVPSRPPAGNRWVMAFPLFVLGSMCLSESYELPVPGGGAHAPGDVAGVNAVGHSLGLGCSNWATRT